jgi:hypothetical protein
MSALTLNQAADVWMVWVSGAIVQASVVALIALAIIRWSRHLPANLKYVLLLLAMLKFFTPPFAGLPVGVFSHFTSPTAPLEAGTPDHIQPSGLPVADVDVRKSDTRQSEFAQMIQAASVVSPDGSASSTPAQVSTAAATVNATAIHCCCCNFTPAASKHDCMVDAVLADRRCGIDAQNCAGFLLPASHCFAVRSGNR